MQNKMITNIILHGETNCACLTFLKSIKSYSEVSEKCV